MEIERIEHEKTIKKYPAGDKRMDQDQFFLLFCFFFIVFVAINELRIISIPQFYFLAMAVLFFCICDKKYFTPALSFLVPLSVWVSLYFIFGFALIIYMIRYNDEIKIHLGVLLIFFVMVIDLSSFFYGGLDLYLWVRTSVYYLAIAFFLFSNVEKDNAKRVLLSFIAGFLTLCILSLLIVLPLVDLEKLISLRFGSNGLRHILDPMGVEFPGENRLALNAVLICSLTLILMKYYRGKNIFFVCIVVFSILIELLTKSNTGLFLLVLTFVLYFWSRRKGIKQFVFGITAAGGIGAALYWFFNSYYPQLFDAITKRIFVSDISNGRIDILIMYFQRMFEHPKALFFGLGSQNYIRYLNMEYDCHNALQQIFVMWGIAGFILMAIFFFIVLNFVRQGVEGKLNSILYYVPIIILFAGAQAGQLDGLYPYLLPVIYSIRLAESNERYKH